ncbi:MAG: hypothetical protein WC023_06510 [Rhodocyclaceae bacterium]
MRLWFKKLMAPATNEMREVDAVQLWEVRWRARTGMWHGDTHPVVECFTSEAQAQEFATAIENAFALLKHSGDGTSVKLVKSK